LSSGNLVAPMRYPVREPENLRFVAGCERASPFGTDNTPASSNPKKRSLELWKSYELLARLTAGVRAIRFADRRHYAMVPIEGRVDCFRLGSGELHRLLLQLHHGETGYLPQPAAVTDVVAMLRGQAGLAKNVEPVYLRVAPEIGASAYFLDLGDPDRRTVKITAAGWEIVEQCVLAASRAACIADAGARRPHRSTREVCERERGPVAALCRLAHRGAPAVSLSLIPRLRRSYDRIRRWLLSWVDAAEIKI
jgi:hypothetical protein